MAQPSLLDAPAGRWVSVSEAARLEGQAGRTINKSSISRFIDRNPDVPVRRDSRGRVVEVEYGALSSARAGSLSVQDSRALTPQPAASQPAPPAPASRKRELEERKLELDLAEREGGLLARPAIIQAIEVIGVTLQQSLERRRRRLATDLVDLGDVRQGELVLKSADRELLTTIATRLQKIAGGAPDAEAPEDLADA